MRKMTRSKLLRKVMRMISKVYLQAADPWQRYAYPSKPCTIGGSGCGEVSMANALIGTPKYANETPATIYGYMKQYASKVNGQCDGTRRAGVVEALKHYGFRNVVRVGVNEPISKAWKELKKGNRIAILIVAGRGGSQGTLWTTGVHYICCRKFKALDNGDYKLWIADSSWRRNSGWHTYRKNLKGAVQEVIIAQYPKYTGKKVSYKPTTPYKGTMPTKNAGFGSKGDHVKAIQEALNWVLNAKLKVDGVYGKDTFNAVLNFAETYGFKNYTGAFGTKLRKKFEAIVKAHKPKAKTKAEKISDEAIKLAWPKGTPKRKYDGQKGKPTDVFKKAYKKAFKKSPSTGCDMSVKLVLHECGLGNMSTSSWAKTNEWLDKKFKRIKPKKKGGKIRKDQFKNGDIVYWKKPGDNHHIYVIVKIGKKWFRAESVQHGWADRRGDTWFHLGKGLNLDVHEVDYIYRAE